MTVGANLGGCKCTLLNLGGSQAGTQDTTVPTAGHRGTTHTLLTAAEPPSAQVEAGTPQPQDTGSTPRPDTQGADPPTSVPPSEGVVIQKLQCLHFVNLCSFCLSLRGRERQQTPLTPNASVIHQKSSLPNAGTVPGRTFLFRGRKGT